LLEALRSEVAYLRRKLDERDEELRRQTVTLAQLVARLPQPAAPPELQAPGVQAAPPQTQDDAAPQEAQHSWWVRLGAWLRGA
jgi:hypothetical protein